VRLSCHTKILRIFFERDLEIFREVFGCTMAVAPAIAAPSVKDVNAGKGSVRRLRNHDIVRAVTCDLADLDASTDPNPLRAPCPADLDEKTRKRKVMRVPYAGLDVTFVRWENQMTQLTITMRFSRVRGRSKLVRKAQQGGRLVNNEDIAVDDLDLVDFTLQENDSFKWNGTLYMVVRVDEDVNRVWLRQQRSQKEIDVPYDKACEEARKQYSRRKRK
jgi:hypothetical protein